jgi:hypothetical protein
MKHYYYLKAQLPALRYGDPPPFSSDYCRELLADLLSGEDAKLLPYCTLYPGDGEKQRTGSDFLDQWLAWRRDNLFALAYARSAKMGRPITIEGEGGDSADAVQTAGTAIGMQNSLDAEIYLDTQSWEMLDNLEGLDAFSVNSVFSYLLKLQLLERRERFKTQEGFENYQKLYNHILENEE